MRGHSFCPRGPTEVRGNFSFWQGRFLFQACVASTSCQGPLGISALFKCILFYFIFFFFFFYPLQMFCIQSFSSQLVAKPKIKKRKTQSIQIFSYSHGGVEHGFMSFPTPPHPGFELKLLKPFPTTLTVTVSKTPKTQCSFTGMYKEILSPTHQEMFSLN